MIEIKNLKTTFGKSEILKGININFNEKQITAIIGQSGCGKSTLLKSINKIVEEENGEISGEISINGTSIDRLNKEELRKKVGLVFQEPIAFPTSVEKNLKYVLDYHFNISKEEKNKRIVDVLKKVKLYDEVGQNLKMPALKLSGGQKQRLAIARCLLAQPEVIMLDEPCSALDILNTQAIEDLLIELKENYTIIIVTHNLSQAKRISDWVVFMDKGRLVETAEKEEFFVRPKSDLIKRQLEIM